MQGRLRKEEDLAFEITTRCACCDRKIEIAINSRLEYGLANKNTTPLVFEPHVDWSTFTDPNIIHAY